MNLLCHFKLKPSSHLHSIRLLFYVVAFEAGRNINGGSSLFVRVIGSFLFRVCGGGEASFGVCGRTESFIHLSVRREFCGHW